jgi:putative flippase GtrA
MPWRQNYLLLLIVAHVMCTSMAYFTHKTFVFKTKGHNRWEYLRFTLFYHSIFAANLLLLPFLVHVSHANPAKIQLAINVLVVIGSYFWHRSVSFKKW